MINAKHPALFMVDTISSLGSYNYEHQKWKVDVTVGGSQKGLMLPLQDYLSTRLAIRRLEAYKNSKLTKSYFALGSNVRK